MLELKKTMQKLLSASVKQSNYMMAIRSNQLFKSYFVTHFYGLDFKLLMSFNFSSVQL